MTTPPPPYPPMPLPGDEPEGFLHPTSTAEKIAATMPPASAAFVALLHKRNEPFVAVALLQSSKSSVTGDWRALVRNLVSFERSEGYDVDCQTRDCSTKLTRLFDRSAGVPDFVLLRNVASPKSSVPSFVLSGFIERYPFSNIILVLDSADDLKKLGFPLRPAMVIDVDCNDLGLDALSAPAAATDQPPRAARRRNP
jgi:hypothetical protein